MLLARKKLGRNMGGSQQLIWTAHHGEYQLPKIFSHNQPNADREDDSVGLYISKWPRRLNKLSSFGPEMTTITFCVNVKSCIFYDS